MGFDRLNFGTVRRRGVICGALLLSLLVCIPGSSTPPDTFRFAILGDRTGEAQPGVFEQIGKEIAAANPAFVIGIGDTIQGLDDATAEAEWRQVDALLQPFRAHALYLAPGNHDVWSDESARLFQKYTKRPLHYSFDYEQLHVTVLDNSRSDQLPPQELAFLETDLKAHAAQPVKMIFSHRPSWLLDAATQNTNAPFHQLAKRYGVQYVIAGHIHQMMRFEVDGVTYVSMASSGGHLRLSGAYEDGWFFGHGVVQVRGTSVDFQMEEAAAPHGKGRTSKLTDWGMIGLLKKPAK